MGKTRSSRRMRNCKSRNKRGGTWSGFQSPLLTNFKSNVRRGITQKSYEMFDQDPIAVVTQAVQDNIDEDFKNYNKSTYSGLENFARDAYNGLDTCSVEKVTELQRQIDVQSPKRKAYYHHVLNKLCESVKNEKKLAQSAVASQQSHGFGLEEQSVEASPLTDAAATATDAAATATDAAATAAASAQPPSQVPPPTDPPKVDYLGAQMNRVPKKAQNMGGFKKPLSTSYGGKSRRRHRRGRTLHKRRKSSKVRKIRRTRSRSRSRR